MSDENASILETSRTLPTRVPRYRWWLRLLLPLVIFVSGTVVGAGGTLLVVRNRVLMAVHHPDKMPEIIAARMRFVLSLSDQQTRQVERILRARQASLLKLRQQYQPELEQELDLLDEQVSAVLDEQQRVRWRGRLRGLRQTWLPTLPGKGMPASD